MRELFVYYRVAAKSADVAKAAVLAGQGRLRQTHPGLEARLLLRAEAGGECETWMETYALPGTAGGIDPDLQSRIEAEARTWVDLIEGDRHLEAFIADR